MKLHRAARKLDELRSDPATDAAISDLTTNLHSTLVAISQLKYRAIEAKQNTEREIEQREEKKQVNLPQLPVLPSTVEVLKHKIALHSVSSVW